MQCHSKHVLTVFQQNPIQCQLQTKKHHATLFIIIQKQITLQYVIVCKRVCAGWLPQTCGRTEAVVNKITRGIIPMNRIYLTITT
jgi:hypothetical protein